MADDLKLPPGATLEQPAQSGVKLPPGSTLVDAGQQPDEKTLSGFGANLLRSAGDFANSLGHAAMHPIDTLVGTGKVIAGAEKRAISALPGFSDAEQRLSGKSTTPEFDAFAKQLSDRYGGLDKVWETMYHDPVGFLSDVSMLAGGGGAAADAAKLGKVAKVASTVADVTNPVNALKLPGAIADATGASGAVSKALTKGALRGGYNVATIDPAVLDTAVKTMNERGIPFSREGLESITTALRDLQQQKLPLAGRAAVDPASVEVHLDQAMNNREWQVNPQTDLKQIDQVRQNFRQRTGGQPIIDPATGKQLRDPKTGVKLFTQGGSIPGDEAEALKEGTYKNNKYGEEVPPHLVATAEGEKALAHGLMVELQNQIPELAGINSQQGDLINLQKVLKGAVDKYLNQGGFLGNLGENVFSKEGALKIAGITGTGAALHEPLIGGAVALAHLVLSDPAVKQQIAIALSRSNTRGAGATMANIFGRINAYTNSLKNGTGQ